MKIKSFFVAILTTFVLLAAASSSYALDVYLENSSFHTVSFFEFPSRVVYRLTYGPVLRGQKVKLPADAAINLAYSYGEVRYVIHREVRSCGFVDFNRVSGIAFNVDLMGNCNVVATYS